MDLYATIKEGNIISKFNSSIRNGETPKSSATFLSSLPIAVTLAGLTLANGRLADISEKPSSSYLFDFKIMNNPIHIKVNVINGPAVHAIKL